MEEERSIDRLARILITLGGIVLICAICWMFRKILVYVIAAFVVSLIGQPLMSLLRKIRFKGKSAPDALLAILTLILLFALLALIITQIIPVVAGILADVSITNSLSNVTQKDMIEHINAWLIRVIPWAGEDFDGVQLFFNKLQEWTDISALPGILGSVASTLAGLVIAVFSVVFISFFFIKDGDLFRRIVGSLVPDKIEDRVSRTILEIERLLSRYFVGLLFEILGVMILDCLGLWLIARVGFNSAIGIAFIAGILNVIPYVGPLIGEIMGVILCVILKLGTGVGLNVEIWLFALIVLAIMLGVQLVDNFIYQPLIYSTSIRANPLEIFIVLLVAGFVGGAVGMLVAIPSYTVIRVIASRFFYSFKPVHRLIPNVEQENTDALV